MSDVAEIEVPEQPAGERTKLIAGWTVLASAFLIVASISTPYDLRRQSTIMVKTETLINIVSGRRTFGAWPVDEHDKKFGYGDLANLEPVKPSFKFIETRFYKKDPSIEEAVYGFKLRDESLTVKARFNPHEKPKRRFF